MEVKRKISSGNGDPDELQLALTHARRMEMAASKGDAVSIRKEHESMMKKYEEVTQVIRTVIPTKETSEDDDDIMEFAPNQDDVFEFLPDSDNEKKD